MTYLKRCFPCLKPHACCTVLKKSYLYLCDKLEWPVAMTFLGSLSVLFHKSVKIEVLIFQEIQNCLSALGGGNSSNVCTWILF